MPRAPCRRNDLTGLKDTIDISDSKREAERLNCNVFSVNTIGYGLGRSTNSRQAVAYVDRFVIPLAIEAGAHFVELVDEAGRHRGWATRINSLEDAKKRLNAHVAKVHSGEFIPPGTSWRVR